MSNPDVGGCPVGGRTRGQDDQRVHWKVRVSRKRTKDEPSQARGRPTRTAEPEEGFEVIPLDLSKVLDVDQAIADAGEREKLLVAIVKETLFPIEGAALFREHLSLSSFINRAISLHRGVLAAVKDANAHAAYTLLRAQLELVALVRYLDLHPDYLDDLEKPKPDGKRKAFRELFKDAATEMPGIRAVYATLSEMAHFGSTALWHPFTITDEESRTMSYETAPHWRHDEEPRVVLGMLAEAEAALLEVLGRYSDHHVLPKVKSFRAKERIRVAFESVGIVADEHGASPISPELANSASDAGLLTWCEEHQAVEPAEDLDPERVEAWARANRRPSDSRER